VTDWPPDEGGEDEGGEETGGPDNLIMMPGVQRIAEPSPLRQGGPVRPAPGDEEDDGLEHLDLSVAPPAHLLDAAVEALLFASDVPLSETHIDGFLGSPGVAKVRAALLALRARYGERSGGVRLVQVAKGWQLRTDPRFGRWVAAMQGGKPTRLSRAALEVLAIVAYRQPVTKADIDDLRGVDSGGVLRMLAERGMVQVTGRRDEPGRPLIYGSTGDFLSLFGLRDLSELPTLRDLAELQHDDPRLGPLGDGSPSQQLLPLASVEDEDEDEDGEDEGLEDLQDPAGAPAGRAVRGPWVPELAGPEEGDEGEE